MNNSKYLNYSTKQPQKKQLLDPQHLNISGLGINLLNQSSCIRERNYDTDNRKRDISFESKYHNIYNPEYSSSSDHPSENSDWGSFDISFELNDSYEELKLENCLSIETKEGNKSLKVNNFMKRQVDQSQPLEPLFSISPNKMQYNIDTSVHKQHFVFESKYVNENLLYHNMTKSTRQDSGNNYELYF